jgi:hypothetical protein
MLLVGRSGAHSVEKSLAHRQIKDVGTDLKMEKDLLLSDIDSRGVLSAIRSDDITGLTITIVIYKNVWPF